MQLIEWHAVFSSDSKVSGIVDKHIPLKRLSKRDLKFQRKPWITSAIKVSIRVKKSLFKKNLTTKSSYYYINFKHYRNKLNHLLKLSKHRYYNNYF